MTIAQLEVRKCTFKILKLRKRSGLWHSVHSFEASLNIPRFQPSGTLVARHYLGRSKEMIV
jgi:hypothetical protein